ncbi:hypothetical protein ACQE3E_15700 [Methylomonas sp. MED-D]|uniref:hypothetical protein n=1 Tax=unclassified Methylomonas TaxID=2608980 RepID=UPI003CFC20F5
MLSNRKRYIQAALETTYGTDAVPTATIQCGDITIKPLAGNATERKIIRPEFGGFGSIRTENYVTLSFSCEFAGAGSAGSAPPWGVLLKGCNFSETLTASAITGTAQVGGSTTSIKLASGASAEDDFYVGMTVSITGGTGNGQKGEIIDYNGTTKVATVAVPWAVAPIGDSTYSIGANALYIPNSSFGTAGNSSLSLYFGVDGVRHILLGARGTVKPSVSAKKLTEMTFEFTGLLGTIADVSSPTTDFSAWQTPQTVSTANTTDINILGFTGAVLEMFDVDISNTVVYRQLVGAESVLITDRRTKGSIQIEATTIAAKDWWTFAKNASYGPICIKHGQTPGNIVGITGPHVQLENPDYAESDGVAMLKADLSFVPVAGNDEIRICAK